jgi:hypothetical protein
MAHPPAHIEIRVGGCNAVDGPKDKEDVELFLSGVLKFALLESLFTANMSHVRKSLSSMTIANIAVTAATTYPMPAITFCCRIDLL